MLIKDIAAQAKTTARTIQRDIKAYNLANETDHSDSLKDDVNDGDLLVFLQVKRELKLVLPTDSDIESPNSEVKPILDESNTAVLSDDVSELRTSTPAKHKKQRQNTRLKVKSKKKTDLQVILSANWMVIVVLLVILWVDMFCFGVIGNHEFGEKWSLAWLPFSIIGLAVGFGSIVTYNRIQEEATANKWKYIFGFLQLCLFEFVINEWLIMSGGVAGLMFVIVSIGTQRSIKG